MKIVLQRGTCEKEFALSVKFSNDLGKLAFFVFDFVSLINDDVMELDFFQVTEANPHTLERGDDDVELTCSYALLNDIFSFLFGSNQLDNPTAWQPFPELVLPVA